MADWLRGLGQGLSNLGQGLYQYDQDNRRHRYNLAALGQKQENQSRQYDLDAREFQEREQDALRLHTLNKERLALERDKYEYDLSNPTTDKVMANYLNQNPSFVPQYMQNRYSNRDNVEKPLRLTGPQTTDYMDKLIKKRQAGVLSQSDSASREDLIRDPSRATDLQQFDYFGSPQYRNAIYSQDSLLTNFPELKAYDLSGLPAARPQGTGQPVSDTSGTASQNNAPLTREEALAELRRRGKL